MKSQEYQRLLQVIAAIGSSKDLATVLSRAVEVAAEGAGCRAGFLYLWNKQTEKLVVEATTSSHQNFIRAIELKLGEGIAGWSALHKEAVLIEANAVADPRFKFVPGLEEDKYQSFMTVPIIDGANNDELVGVFTMYTLAPNTFSPESIEYVRTVATLVAGVVEKARLYTEMEHKLEVLERLNGLGKVLSSDEPIDLTLHKAMQIAMEVTTSDLSLLFLLNDDGRSLALGGKCTTLPQIRFSEWDVVLDDELRAWLKADQPLTGWNDQLLKALQRPVMESLRTWAASTLMGGERTSGLLIVFRTNPHSFVDSELSVLATVANYCAIALDRAKLVQCLMEKNKKSDFFHALLTGNYREAKLLIGQGSMLGCDLTKRNLVVAVEVQHNNNNNNGLDKSVCEKSEALLGARLERMVPGSIYIQRDHLIHALLPYPGNMDVVKQKLENVLMQVESLYPVQVWVGIGNVCSVLKDYPRGFEEALEALRIGQILLIDKSRVVVFNLLGIYRHLYKIWLNDGVVRDEHQEMIAKIIDYDRKHSTSLIETLETHLETLGHGTEASKRLYVHRNTLRNRLGKISSLIGVDINEKDNWFPLFISLKIVKFREMARAIDG